MAVVSVALTFGAIAEAGFALDPEQKLGEALYLDKNLSLNRNQSCADCHGLNPSTDPQTGKPLPAAGFVDPHNVENGSPVSEGSVAGRFGALNAPSVGYAAFSPFFHWNAVEGLYVGGQFWNGRADTLAEQAGGPFLNPVEMAMPNQWSVVSRVKSERSYVAAFTAMYGMDLAQIPDYDPKTPDAPIPPGIEEVYGRITQAIAAFEKSRVFNRFDSKYDFHLAGRTGLSPQERLGLALFNGKGKCSACHVSTTGVAPDGSVLPPLFTDFTYDNLGLPRNVKTPGNPLPDKGLGGRGDIAARDPKGGELGKHKVMSLRNIALTAPYGHNGVFATLEQITYFYSTRDVLGRVADNRDPGFGVKGWPAPEVAQNVNREELGNLGLTGEEEAAIVAFMRTLTDDYPQWGKDPKVPPGTPSPFAEMPLPPFP
jgi:cytochrome c peroxidase